MSPTERADWRYDAALLATVLVWGLNFAVLKAALAVMHPHVVNLFRFLISAVVLGALYARRQRRDGKSLFAPLRAHAGPIVFLGLLGFVLYQYCFIVGIDHTKAGNAALIMGSAPLWTALTGTLFALDHLRRSAWLGLTLTLVGTVVIVLAGAKEVDLSAGTFYGNTLMLLAAAFWGAYTALSRPVMRHVSPIGVSFLGLLVAYPLLVAIAVPHVGGVVWAEVDWWVWAALVFSGGLSTGIAVVVWNAAVRAVGPSHTAVYGNLVPVAALLSSVLILGESVTPTQIVGGALIIGGLVVVRRSRGSAKVEVRSAKGK